MQKNYFDLSHRKVVLYSFLLSWITGLILYHQTIEFEYLLLDDNTYLQNRAKLYVKENLWQSLVSVWTTFPREEPLLIRDTVWSIVVYLFGTDNTSMLHFVQTSFHCLNTFLVFYWLFLITNNIRFAAMTTCLHFTAPYCVESVAWIMEFKGVLSSTWLFSTLVSYILFLKSKSKLRWIWYFTSCVTTALALMSKQNTLILPGLIMLNIGVSQTIFTGSGAVQIKKFFTTSFLKEACLVLPHIAISAYFTFWFMQQSQTSMALEFHKGTTLLEFLPRIIAFTPIIFVQYVYIAFIKPVYHFFLDWPLNETELTFSVICFSIASGISFLSLTYWSLKRSQWTFFFILFFLISIFPYLEWVRDLVWLSNRYLYVSGLAIFACFCLSIEKLLQSQQKKIRYIGLSCFCVIATYNIYRTIITVPIFQNSETFWTHELNHSPDRPKVYTGICGATTKKLENPLLSASEQNEIIIEFIQFLDDAIDHFDLLNPDLSKRQNLDARDQSLILLNRAYYGWQRNEPPEEIAIYFNEAFNYYPRYAKAHLWYGEFLLEQALKEEDENKRFEKTKAAYESCLRATAIRGLDQFEDPSGTAIEINKFFNERVPDFLPRFIKSIREKKQAPALTPNPENNQE